MGRSEIPSYVLYGEPYGSPFPDCLHCEPLSERSRLHDWQIRPHRHHGLHQFFWIARGAAVLSSDAAQRALTAPAAVVNAPLAVHGFEWEPGSEGYVVTIPTVNLERSLPGPTALLSRLDRSLVLQFADGDPSLAQVTTLFAAIDAEYRGRQEGRAEALLCQAGLLALWLLRAAGRQEGTGATEGRPHLRLIRRFLALVEDRFREHRPLSFYADELGITTTHLSRLCRRQFGLSAQAVVHDRLVLEAKRILAYTPASIMHVAQDLGFRDPAYFTKFFAHHVGETPTAFRKAFAD